jgi:hypothetical protein
MWHNDREKQGCRLLLQFLADIDTNDYFPLLILADQTLLSKVSNPNDKFRQTVGGDSGKRRLFG